MKTSNLPKLSVVSRSVMLALCLTAGMVAPLQAADTANMDTGTVPATVTTTTVTTPAADTKDADKEVKKAARKAKMKELKDAGYTRMYGAMMVISTPGNGSRPGLDDVVTIKYTTKGLMDGVAGDSSDKYSSVLSEMPKGLAAGLMNLSTGAKADIIVGPDKKGKHKKDGGDDEDTGDKPVKAGPMIYSVEVLKIERK